ncbi:MAG: hypothetical protein JXX28_00080 [Deltaproteobacteria bacterium]|nr:hypothetical protein [Deltaproteobacteria bacterium]
MPVTALTAPLPLPATAQSLDALRAPLDQADSGALRGWLGALNRRELAALFDLAAEGAPMRPDELLRPDGGVTIATGRNQLPVFSRFEKRFARVGDEIVGYNHTPWLVRLLAGAGHFVVRPADDASGELWIDYTLMPSGQHREFPALSEQHRPLFPFIYGDMIDKVRRVSAQVLIGHSFKPSGRGGLNDDAYFALLLPDEARRLLV